MHSRKRWWQCAGSGLVAGAFAAFLAGILGCSTSVKGSLGSSSSTTSDGVSIEVTGDSQVRLGGKTQFKAIVTNSSDTSVNWEVNGVVGGSSTTGTISSSGLYTTPSSIPSSDAVTITAVSQAVSGASASTTENILNPAPTISSATVSANGSSYSITVEGTGYIQQSQIQVQGIPVTTTFVSATQLTATADLSLAAGTTTLALAVANPDPGADTSATYSAKLAAVAPIVTVSISGNSQVRVGSTVQFTAAVTNSSNTAVSWKVNNVAGGTSTTGTISSTGLFTPPTATPSPNTVTITAVSQASATASGSLTETILNPLPAISSATASGMNPSYTISVSGTGFVNGSVVQVQGAAATTSFVSPTLLTATISMNLATGTATVPVVVVNPDPGGMTSASVSAPVQATLTTATAAARLLDQATFGPTLNDIQHVETVGLSGYLSEQFQLPATTLATISTPPPTPCTGDQIPCLQSEWWQAALTAPDQLRQRVAFALSEMFVISTDSVKSAGVVSYHNMLVNDAFGNFATLLNDVTLSPGMGIYLNMMNSNKPSTGQIANENYAREAMQLFSLGLDLLNQDGSLQLDGNGNPIPTYTQDQVQAYARAYTGWTSATASGGVPTNFIYSSTNYASPMMAVESAHDETSKTLLDGTVLPAGQTAEDDLAGALQSIFNHPNVAPFISRQLIQHLVTSNPSPAYVSRVAAVFSNDGNGVRGNLQAVITAILLDPEARAGDTDPTMDGGHLREPVLWMTDVMRGLGATNNDATAGNNVVANASYNSPANYLSALGQTPYGASSVFNFFPPNYVIPGTTANAPEFGLENTANATLRLSLANTIVSNKITNFTFDLSATGTFGTLASSPGNLVNALNTIFMHGQMPSDMQTEIVNQITPITDMGERARVAVYLVITSSQYKIEH
jgi:uncharacterized protein (DUF1800 family)